LHGLLSRTTILFEDVELCITEFPNDGSQYDGNMFHKIKETMILMVLLG
jgi:hypothetical protein